jgi:hypothetical protein
MRTVDASRRGLLKSRPPEGVHVFPEAPQLLTECGRVRTRAHVQLRELIQRDEAGCSAAGAARLPIGTRRPVVAARRAMIWSSTRTTSPIV